MKIKEVEEIVHMNSQTIRYYDKLGFLHPSRDDNGYRNYTMEDVLILKRIRFLRELDISLELIGVILDNPNEFQTILEKHIQLLKAQVDNLEEIERRCEEINKRNVPLLDAIVEGEFQDIQNISNSKLKEVLQKTRDYIQPFSCITLGHKTTSFELIKKMSGILLICIFSMLLFSIFLFNLLKISIPSYIFVIGFLVLLIIFCIGMIHEKYFEFRDKDFYIYDSRNQNKFKVIFSILRNNTLNDAYHYVYSDIYKVNVKVVKKYSSIGYGISKIFNIIYHFEMKDGNTFMIDSTFSSEEQHRKTVFDILDYHDVLIEDKQNLREGLIQEEMSLYDYLDKHI